MPADGNAPRTRDPARRIPDAVKREAVRLVAVEGMRALHAANALNISVHTVLDECRKANAVVHPVGNPNGWRGLRTRRPDVKRSRIESSHRVPKYELDRGRMEYPEREHPRAGHGKPPALGECRERGLGTSSPCPYVSCRYHLAVAVQANGSLRRSYPDREVDEIPETCTLAAADRGGLTLDEVGARLNLTRERVRQIELAGLANLRAALPPEARAMLDALVYAADAPRGGLAGVAVVPRRRLPVVQAPPVRAVPPAPPLALTADERADARALAATRAPFLSPRTWEGPRRAQRDAAPCRAPSERPQPTPEVPAAPVAPAIVDGILARLRRRP